MSLDTWIKFDKVLREHLPGENTFHSHAHTICSPTTLCFTFTGPPLEPWNRFKIFTGRPSLTNWPENWRKPYLKFNEPAARADGDHGGLSRANHTPTSSGTSSSSPLMLRLLSDLGCSSDVVLTVSSSSTWVSRWNLLRENQRLREASWARSAARPGINELWSMEFSDAGYKKESWFGGVTHSGSGSANLVHLEGPAKIRFIWSSKNILDWMEHTRILHNFSSQTNVYWEGMTKLN